MQERLIIKNFGPIKDADFTFGRFNVLIGEQATGKSTVLKLLAVCRYFSYLTGIFIENDNPFAYGIFDWGLQNFRHDHDTCISYSCSDYELIYQGVDKTEYSDGSKISGPRLFQFTLNPISTEFKSLLDELKGLQSEKNSHGEMKGIPYTFFKTSVAQVMHNPLYLSTDRAIEFAGRQSSPFEAQIVNAEKLYNIKAQFASVETSIKPLGLSYIDEGGSGPMIRKDNESSFYSLEAGASGYQSTVPIVLAIKSYTDSPKTDSRFLNRKTKPKTFIIEEPELNLFPTAQYELMKFLVDKTMNYGNTMFIATHSPYVLSSISTLMNAFQSGNVDKAATESVISQEFWLRPDKVSAYLLKSDGTSEDIIDYEEGMIKSGKIDKVSGTLNHAFDQLLNIQFGINDANA